MFFLGIQPNTDLEQRLLEEGYLSAGYNPLMLTPTSIRKLLYNPAPLNSFIAKACLMAWERKDGSRDPRKWTGSLSQAPKESGAYADANLIRGIEGIRTRCPLVPGGDSPVPEVNRQSSIVSRGGTVQDINEFLFVGLRLANLSLV